MSNGGSIQKGLVGVEAVVNEVEVSKVVVSH